MYISMVPGSANKFIKFNRHLPVYNWTYPLNTETMDIDSNSLYSNLKLYENGQRAIYIHIPFCKTICTYCNLARGVFSDYAFIQKYVDALVKEIQFKSNFKNLTSRKVDTIYFGGGTPSVLSVPDILRIGKALRDNFDLSGLVEFNFECEVKTITEEKLLAMKEIGVNKPRFGVQTFVPKFRSIFNLTSTLDQIIDSSKLLKKIFPVVTFDMLYGLNGQTIEDFTEDILTALSLELDNIDFYPINNLVAQTVLHSRFRENGMSPKSALEKMNFNIFLREFLRVHGYLPHNGHGYVRTSPAELERYPVITGEYTYKYYEFIYGYMEDEVIGFGNSAISILSEFQVRNETNREKYIEQMTDNEMCLQNVERHPPAYGKGIMQYLPYNGELDKRRIKWDMVPNEVLDRLNEAIQANLVTDEGDRLKLTLSGWYWYVNLMYYFCPMNEIKPLDDWIMSQLANPEISEGSMDIPFHGNPYIEAKILKNNR